MRLAKVFITVVIQILFNMDDLLLMSSDNTPVGSPHQFRSMGESQSKQNKLQQLKEEENHIKKIIKEHQQKQQKIYALRKEVNSSSLTKCHLF